MKPGRSASEAPDGLVDAAGRWILLRLDARTGQILWKFGLAGSIQSPPITYAFGGKQYIAVAANDTLFAFTLRR